MKERAVAATVLVLMALGAAERHDGALARGVPAPPPRMGHVRRCLPNECPQPVCPKPVCPQPQCPPPPPLPKCPAIPPCPNLSCPEPVCPQPQCPPLPPLPKCPAIPPCPNLSCPEPVCPQPQCPPLPPLAKCPPPPPAPTIPPCPNLSCPKPVCPAPTCPKPSCPTLPAPSVPTCPAKGASCTDCMWKVLVNYDHFPGFGFYKAYKTRVNWHQAKALCAADGAHLAIINSAKEAEVFKLLFHQNHEFSHMFIGIYYFDGEHEWKTVTGEPLSTTGYTEWADQPDTFFGKNCGTIDSNALLNDRTCEWMTGFICEVSEEKVFRQ